MSKQRLEYNSQSPQNTINHLLHLLNPSNKSFNEEKSLKYINYDFIGSAKEKKMIGSLIMRKGTDENKKTIGDLMGNSLRRQDIQQDLIEDSERTEGRELNYCRNDEQLPNQMVDNDTFPIGDRYDNSNEIGKKNKISISTMDETFSPFTLGIIRSKTEKDEQLSYHRKESDPNGNEHIRRDSFNNVINPFQSCLNDPLFSINETYNCNTKIETNLNHKATSYSNMQQELNKYPIKSTENHKPKLFLHTEKCPYIINNDSRYDYLYNNFILNESDWSVTNKAHYLSYINHISKNQSHEELLSFGKHPLRQHQKLIDNYTNTNDERLNALITQSEASIRNLPVFIIPSSLSSIETINPNDNDTQTQVIHKAKCQICGKTFPTSQGLGGHMGRRHKNQSIQFNNRKQTRDKNTHLRERLLKAKKLLCSNHDMDYDTLIQSNEGKIILKALLRKHSKELTSLKKTSFD